MFFERRWLICLCLTLATLGAAKAQQATAEAPATKAAAAPQPAPMLTGGIQLITIQTPKGPFKVWTKKVGHSPRIKVLLLHGGPGATHEYFEAMESFLPGTGIEF
jgi:proline iminopeptidase